MLEPNLEATRVQGRESVAWATYSVAWVGQDIARLDLGKNLSGGSHMSIRTRNSGNNSTRETNWEPILATHPCAIRDGSLVKSL